MRVLAILIALLASVSLGLAQGVSVRSSIPPAVNIPPNNGLPDYAPAGASAPPQQPTITGFGGVSYPPPPAAFIRSVGGDLVGATVDAPFVAQGKLPGVDSILANNTGFSVATILAAGYHAMGAFGPDFLDCAVAITTSGCLQAYQVSGPLQTVGSASAPVALTITANGTRYVVQGYLYKHGGPLVEYMNFVSGVMPPPTAPGMIGATVTGVGVAAGTSILSSPALNAALAVVDGQAALGYSYAFVNEPYWVNTDLTACCNQSDPYAALTIFTGFNILANYAHNKYSGRLKLGFSNSAPPAFWLSTFQIAAANGVPLHMDFVSRETYESRCCDATWTAFHAAYPNVLRIDYVESLPTFCSFPSMDPGAGNDDLVRFWDSDNYQSWGYPIEEAETLQYIQWYGASGLNKAALCGLTYSRDKSVTSQIWPGNSTRTIGDGANRGGAAGTYTITTCDYRVFSGPTAAYGINSLNGVDYIPAGWTKTVDWTTRTCNSAFTIAMPSSPPPGGTNGAYTAPNGACRNEIVTPFTGYILNNILIAVRGAPAYLHGISGKDGSGNSVSQGTYVNGTGGTGGWGMYLVNKSQTVGSVASPVSLTVGRAAIRGYIEPTGGGVGALGVNTETPIPPITAGASVMGPGVTAGTVITGSAGVYSITPAQSSAVGSTASPANLSNNYGAGTCYVEVRAHDNSPAGTLYPGAPAGIGWTSFESFSIFF